MLIVLALLLILLVAIKIVSKCTMGRCKSHTCLVGKTALITGGNSGIGYETALGLAARGCRVIIADISNCDQTKENIIRETGNSNIVLKYLDLASLDSVRKLAKDINESEERLDILINNAGATALGHTKTKDGLHIGMQVNHFGPFLLTHLLVGILKKSAPSKIIFVSSLMAFIHNLTLDNLNYSKQSLFEVSIYANSKLCTIITASEFARRLKEFGVTSNSLHPGVVYTQIYRKFFSRMKVHEVLKTIQYIVTKYTLLKVFAKSPEEGAQTTLHLALSNEVKNVTGKFFVDCKPFLKPTSAVRKSFAEEIWKASEDYVQLANNERL